MLLFAITACAVVFLDQLTKWLITSNIALGESVTLIPGVLNLRYTRNPDGAMGLFDWIPTGVRMAIMIIAIAIVIAFVVKTRPKKLIEKLSLAFIVGGGIGNMIDMIVRGGHEVVDFVDFCAFPNLWTYIFNVADIFVCVGAGLMIIYLIHELVIEIRKPEETEASTYAEAKESVAETDEIDTKESVEKTVGDDEEESAEETTDTAEDNSSEDQGAQEGSK